MGGSGAWPGDQWAANVTNVVKPTQFTSPHKDPCYKRRQSKPKNRHYQRKSPQIDDVCNNMHQSTPKNSTRETHVTPTGSRGTGPRCRRAVAGPGQTTSQRTEQHQRPGTTGVEGTGESGGPGCSARGRRRGLAGLRADAQAHVSTPSPTGVEGAGGSRGPGCDTRGRRQGLARQRVDAQSTPQQPGTTGAEGAGGSGGHGRAAKRRAWSRCRWVAAGPGRASRSTTPSRQARVWRSRGRAAAHRHSKRPGPQVRQA